MESKEEKMLELFFNNPTKEWHFEEILRDAPIARSKADRWLKQFITEGLISKTKKKGKAPFYISRYDSPAYKNRKKLFAFNRLYQSGLMNHLSSLPKTKAIILFGSFARSDWYAKSDIDIFIFGNPEGLRIADYELKLNRDIQLFVCNDDKELNNLGEGLTKSIIKGNFIKGDMDLIRVNVNG